MPAVRNNVARLWPRHIILIAAATLVTSLLQGCVTSQLPLLDESTAVTNPSFAGHYSYTASTRTGNVDIYLKGNTYLVAESGKLRYIATVAPWDDKNNLYVAQVRETGKHQYSYILIQPAKAGAVLNLNPCPVEPHCGQINDLNGLSMLAGADRLTATKLGELGE